MEDAIPVDKPTAMAMLDSKSNSDKATVSSASSMEGYPLKSKFGLHERVFGSFGVVLSLESMPVDGVLEIEFSLLERLLLFVTGVTLSLWQISDEWELCFDKFCVLAIEMEEIGFVIGWAVMGWRWATIGVEWRGWLRGRLGHMAPLCRAVESKKRVTKQNKKVKNIPN
eukprot:15329448-Ditylum_brightwellii.AAC.1